MIKLGYDGKRAFFNNTGLGNYSRDTIRVVSKNFKDNKYFIYTSNNIKNKRLDFIKSNKNIYIKTPKNFFYKSFDFLWRSKKVIDDLLHDKIDIYHGLSNEIPYGIEVTGIKTIVTIHDLIFIRYPNLFQAFDRYIYFKKFKYACEKANKIIAVSTQTKKDIIKFFNISEDKITVIYQGCNNIFQKEITIDKQNLVAKKYNLPNKFLLYVGTIEERKNLLSLIKAIKKIPNQKLVVIGNGKKYKKKCREYIRVNNLEKNILFINNLSLNEIRAIYAKAEIMIYPSIFEGFGIPILEALFSKVPVITSKNGCFSEAGGPHTSYINPLSSEEIKNEILKIQSSNEIRNKMIRNGYAYAQNFTDEKIANNLMKLYKSL
tara:strand:- start:12408 stop:13532 length:1125 start_codon:yes stop_codon:yes gene_type:complete